MSYIDQFKTLYPHQQKLLQKNPNKAILNWEMRVAKSLPACYWIDMPCRSGNTYIITPKQNVKDWIAFKTKATVLTKEQFKKLASSIRNPTAIVVDEAHYFAAPLFTKGRSQLAKSFYDLVRKYPNCHILLLTATAVRQSAWSLHTLLCYIGIYYDWKKWREEFFELKSLPFLAYPAWMPRNDWRIKIRKYLEKHCDIVSLKDIVKDLPPVKNEIINIKQDKYVPPTDRVVTWVDEHLWEQQGKVEEILKLGYKKLIVVCKYTEQIQTMAKKLSEDKPVFILDGHTKDPSETKRLAQEADECYFICQSSMLIGWDGYTFGAMVFASMSHSCVDFVQATGRQRHLEHLRPVTNIFLIGGRWDRRIYDTVAIKGKTFNPHQYLHE